MRIRSIFRFPGSKSRLSVCQSILSFFPSTIREYREPFVGSGGIYFAQNKYESRWVNDINKDLISVYNEFINNSDGFIRSCREIPCLMENPECNKNLRMNFKVLLDGSSSPLRYFFLNRTCWGGRVRNGLTYFTYPEGWNIVRPNGYLERIAEFMVGTKVTCGDYLPLLIEPGDDVFIYLDPPYMNDTERPETSKFYDDSFDMDEHVRLADELQCCDHKWCLSYDDHPEIRRLYKDYYIYDLNWTYNVSSMNRPKGDELIIMNYIPVI